MYVLIKARRGVLSDENKVRGFNKLKGAQKEMFRQVHEYIRDNYRDEMLCVDWHISTTSAYVDPCTGYDWHIFEVREIA